MRNLLIAFSIMLLSAMNMVSVATAIDLQGHRGARGLAPENSLPGFAKALEIGVTTLEFDLVVSKDDVVIINHDLFLSADLARDADGQWVEKEQIAVYQHNFAELQRYDIGRMRADSRYAQRFQTQQPVDGTRLTSLEALFAWLESNAVKEMRFNMEMKSDPRRPELTPPPEKYADLIAQLVEKFDRAGEVTIQSFDWRMLQAMQKRAPNLPTVYLSAQQPWLDSFAAGSDGSFIWTAGYDLADYQGEVPAMIADMGGAIWSPYFRDLTPESLAAARQRGLQVVVWTVNDTADIAQMLDWGVDGVISDYPDRLRQVAVEKGLPLPKTIDVSLP